MTSWIENIFYLLLLIAVVVVSVAFEGTVRVPSAVFAVALTYLVCGIIIIVLVNMRPEKPRPDRGDLDAG